MRIGKDPTPLQPPAFGMFGGICFFILFLILFFFFLFLPELSSQFLSSLRALLLFALFFHRLQIMPRFFKMFFSFLFMHLDAAAPPVDIVEDPDLSNVVDNASLRAVPHLLQTSTPQQPYWGQNSFPCDVCIPG